MKREEKEIWIYDNKSRTFMTADARAIVQQGAKEYSRDILFHYSLPGCHCCKILPADLPLYEVIRMVQELDTKNENNKKESIKREKIIENSKKILMTKTKKL